MEFVSGSNFIRPNHMKKAGDVINGHAHNFDHTSIVMTGSVRVRAGEFVQEFYSAHSALRLGRDPNAACHVLIAAHVEHEITALEDDTVFWCVYSHRNPQGEVVQHFNGHDRAYV